MPTYKVVARVRAKVNYFIDAESEEEALRKWEDVDPSMASIDEDSIDHEEFYEIVPLNRVGGAAEIG